MTNAVGAIGCGFRVSVVTAEIQVPHLDVQLAVFDEALGLVLRRGHSHLRSPCCNSQGDHAPLHHAHRDLLLWFRKSTATPNCFWLYGAALSFYVREKCISRWVILATPKTEPFGKFMVVSLTVISMSQITPPLSGLYNVALLVPRNAAVMAGKQVSWQILPLLSFTAAVLPARMTCRLGFC